MIKLFVIILIAYVVAQDFNAELDIDPSEMNFGESFSAADLTFDLWRTATEMDFGFTSPDVLQHYEENFNANAELINSFNSVPQSFKLTFNKFAHLSGEEFVATRTGFVMPTEVRGLPAPAAMPAFNKFTEANVPKSLSWKSKMQPVLDQGACGSCWSFAVIGMLEGVQKMKSFLGLWNKKLSPQYLMDCDSTNNRCSGGNPRRSLNWIQNSSAWKLPTLTDYPYTASNTSQCRSTVAKTTLSMKNNSVIIVNGNNEQLKVILANYGPVVVVIWVDKFSQKFQFYGGGVINDPLCPKSTPTFNQCNQNNHAVVLVGYGTDSVQGDYWLLKNSWGASWGEGGYFKLARNALNNCNTACFAYVAE